MLIRSKHHPAIIINMSSSITAPTRVQVGREDTNTFVITAAYFALFIALGLSTGSLGPTIPALALQTKVGLSTISYLFTARSFGYVIGSARIGRLFDKHPGHPIVALTLVAMIVTLATIPFARSFWLLVATMLVLGAAEATLDVGGNALLAWLHKQRLGPVLNALHSFFGVGALIAPMMIAGLITFKHGPVEIYFILALVLLPLPVLFLRWPSPQNHASSTTRTATVTNRRLVFLFALFLFLYAGAEIGFGGWIFTYATTNNLASQQIAAYLTSAFYGALTLGRFVAVPLAARFRSTTLLAFDLGGSLLSLAVMIYWHHSFAAVVVGTLGLGFSMASIFPTLFSLAAETMGLTGHLTGRFIVGASLGAMTVPFLIGQLIEGLGPAVVIYVVFGALAAAYVTLMFTVKAARTTRYQVTQE